MRKFLTLVHLWKLRNILPFIFKARVTRPCSPILISTTWQNNSNFQYWYPCTLQYSRVNFTESWNDATAVWSNSNTAGQLWKTLEQYNNHNNSKNNNNNNNSKNHDNNKDSKIKIPPWRCANGAARSTQRNSASFRRPISSFYNFYHQLFTIQAFFIKSFVIIIFLQASTFCCSRDGRLGLLAGWKHFSGVFLFIYIYCKRTPFVQGSSRRGFRNSYFLSKIIHQGLDCLKPWCQVHFSWLSLEDY